MRVLLVGILPEYDASYSLGLASLKAYALQWPALREQTQIDIRLFRTGQVYAPEDGIASVNPVLENAYEVRPDVIGFSCYAWNIDLESAMADVLLQQDKCAH